MALHVDANGVGSVTPNYLYHQNGTVSDPLQRQGSIAHLPGASGVSEQHQSSTGHPWFGGKNRSTQVIGTTK